ncbi:MAG: cell division protein SepF, partial [Thermoplasmata archaeon]|nr:cell division protein SepF [Thermoplasmata archaeon]
MAESAYPRPFIDLSTISPGEGVGGAEKMVKVAEIDSFKAISKLADIIYQGHILILDFSPIANDDMELRRCVE